MVERFSPPAAYSTPISEEGKKLVQEAYVEMSAWLDKSVDALLAGLRQRLEQEAAGLEDEVGKVREEANAASAKLRDALGEFKDDVRDLGGDPAVLKKLVKRTDKLVQQVEKDLADREERWRKVGSAVAGLGKRAVGG